MINELLVGKQIQVETVRALHADPIGQFFGAFTFVLDAALAFLNREQPLHVVAGSNLRPEKLHEEVPDLQVRFGFRWCRTDSRPGFSTTARAVPTERRTTIAIITEQISFIGK